MYTPKLAYVGMTQALLDASMKLRCLILSIDGTGIRRVIR